MHDEARHNAACIAHELHAPFVPSISGPTLPNGLDDESGVIHNSRVVPVAAAANL